MPIRRKQIWACAHVKAHATQIHARTHTHTHRLETLATGGYVDKVRVSSDLELCNGGPLPCLNDDEFVGRWREVCVLAILHVEGDDDALGRH
jgi:hypothetical protein